MDHQLVLFSRLLGIFSRSNADRVVWLYAPRPAANFISIGAWSKLLVEMKLGPHLTPSCL
jgi:hypothetical protein